MEFWCCISAMELNYMKSFAKDIKNWADRLQLDQLRCLWTAYCFHQNMEVDTYSYDNELKQIWQEMREAEGIFGEFEAFCSFMATFLA